jgi:hypothetical protein
MNIKRIIQEEIDSFEWVDGNIIPVGSCIVKQLHKLHPDTHSVEELGEEINLEYLVVGYDGNDIILRPRVFPDEERFDSRVDRNTIEDNLNNGVTFCQSPKQ